MRRGGGEVDTPFTDYIYTDYIYIAGLIHVKKHALFLFVGLILQKRFKLTLLKVNRYLRKFLKSYFELCL